jgi:glycosyltransferase involved in cell wall biosynthesis
VIAWTTVGARAAEIASELGGESRCWYWNWPAVIRYPVAAILTAAHLAWRRPRSVIVTNPPVFPALIAWAYGRIARAPIVIDAHPGSFGLKEDRIGKLMLPVTRWLAPHVSCQLVTAEELGAQIREWGGTAEILHEAPPLWRAPGGESQGDRFRALFVGRFAADEPVKEVIEAAARNPEVDVEITGEIELAPEGLVDCAPANVRFLGFLGEAAYAEAIGRADAVISLTTEPTSVMRSAYEAVYARRPLLVSDSQLLRELFPFAIHVRNDADGIAEGLREARRESPVLAARADEARRLQSRRWASQLEQLRRNLNQTEAEPQVAQTRQAADRSAALS